MAGFHVLERRQLVPAPLGEVFGFFSNAANLGRITPPWLHFRILTPMPVRMCVDARIEYQIRLLGIPMRWRTRIAEWSEQESFVDEQESGPYASWIHTHAFEAAVGGTWMTDRVDYELPFGPVGRVVCPVMVRPALDRIFSFRRDAIAEIFCRSTTG